MSLVERFEELRARFFEQQRLNSLGALSSSAERLFLNTNPLTPIETSLSGVDQGRRVRFILTPYFFPQKPWPAPHQDGWMLSVENIHHEAQTIFLFERFPQPERNPFNRVISIEGKLWADPFRGWEDWLNLRGFFKGKGYLSGGLLDSELWNESGRVTRQRRGVGKEGEEITLSWRPFKRQDIQTCGMLLKTFEARDEASLILTEKTHPDKRLQKLYQDCQKSVSPSVIRMISSILKETSNNEETERSLGESTETPWEEFARTLDYQQAFILDRRDPLSCDEGEQGFIQEVILKPRIDCDYKYDYEPRLVAVCFKGEWTRRTPDGGIEEKSVGDFYRSDQASAWGRDLRSIIEEVMTLSPWDPERLERQRRTNEVLWREDYSVGGCSG